MEQEDGVLRIIRKRSFVLHESRLSSARADPIRGTGGENLPLLTPDTFTEPHTEASQHARNSLGHRRAQQIFPCYFPLKKIKTDQVLYLHMASVDPS